MPPPTSTLPPRHRRPPPDPVRPTDRTPTPLTAPTATLFRAPPAARRPARRHDRPARRQGEATTELDSPRQPPPPPRPRTRPDPDAATRPHDRDAPTRRVPPPCRLQPRRYPPGTAAHPLTPSAPPTAPQHP